MGRILALDIGDRRIGTALSDETHAFAFPGEVIQREPEGFRKDLAKVAHLVKAKDVERIVVGLPLNMDGTPSAQTEKTLDFTKRLAGACGVPVVQQDERLSSFEAEQLLAETGRKRSEARASIDSLAAAVILKEFLERLQGGVE